MGKTLKRWCVWGGHVVRGDTRFQRIKCPGCGREVALRSPVSGGTGYQIPRHHKVTDGEGK